MTSISSHNHQAIRIATRVSDYHRQRNAENTRSREDLFPAFDPTGLGVTLECEKMGNQPVSDELAQRASSLGIEFEHLGVTLGTVIHNVCLKEDLSDELTDFVRATLLERKVIFFRDQNLSKDEHVKFSRQFCELAAFPFGKPGKTLTSSKSFMTKSRPVLKMDSTPMSPGWKTIPGLRCPVDHHASPGW